MLNRQNGDRIVTTDCVTSLHPIGDSRLPVVSRYDQYRIKVGAIDAAALDPFKK